VAVWISCFGSPAVGQTTGTLDVSASLVEYEGFLRTGAAVFSPAIRHDAPNFSIGGQGSWTLFESGNQILQATAAGAWLSAPRERWRLELAGAAGASRYAQETGTGHGLVRTRVHLFGESTGAWFGLTTGASFGDSLRVPAELAASVWSVEDRIALVGTIALTRLAHDRYVDILGMARWIREPLELETRLGARPWAHSTGGPGEAVTRLYGDVSVLLALGERISIALSGGTSPSDPVRRLLSATYLSAGLRLRLAGTSDAAASPLADARVAAALARVSSSSAGEVRLEIAAAGELRALRVHAPAASSVELTGDFTDWQPVALTHTGAGVWEVRLPLTPGVHRVNVRVDGRAWSVPAGARREVSEFGGAVGVVVVR
jgi:hypothetical protein